MSKGLTTRERMKLLREERDGYRDALAKLCEAYSTLALGNPPPEVLERRSIDIAFGTLRSGSIGWELSVCVDGVEDPTWTRFVAAHLHCLMVTLDHVHQKEHGTPYFGKAEL